MNIGRKLLTDSEFANLWGILYQEFHSLSTTSSCNTSLVYNTIYVICTSNSFLEEKLYWKIGDFLYSRCKHHRDEILSSQDYIAEYALRFREYDILVMSINRLGCFLNESTKGRKLSDFGYLLWERVVIQNLRNEFFEEVFDYPRDDRLDVIGSFEKIVPDPDMKMLYYIEKYEKVAIERLRSKYRGTAVTDLFEFCKHASNVAKDEEKRMGTRFLRLSYPKVRRALEDALLGERYYELILNLADFLRITNAPAVRSIRGCGVSHRPCNSAKSIKSAKVENIVSCLGEFRQASQVQMPESGDIGYEPLSPEKIDRLKLFIDEEFSSNRALCQIEHLINRGPQGAFDEATLSRTHRYNDLMCQLGTLDTGFTILKKAYALYVDSIVRASTEVLASSVSDVHALVKSLDLFDCNDFTQILFSIMRYYLQRAKPCFMGRLCEFTNLLSGDTFNQISTVDLRPFSQGELSAIFCVLVNLVCDRREFLNMYQSTLRSRILNRTSDLNWELRILSMLGIPPDDRSVMMVHEANSCSGHLKLLNSCYWNIDPENSSFRLPCELLREIRRENPSVLIYESDGREADCSEQIEQSLPGSENVCKESQTGSADLRFKLSSGGDKDKAVSIAHQYSKITLLINKRTIAMNVYQYSAIDVLKKGPCTVSGISTRLRLPESLIRGIMGSLQKCGIVLLEKDEYHLYCKEIADCDISAVEISSEQDLDVCIDSYLQSLCVSRLKRYGKMGIGSLTEEVKQISRLEVEESKVGDAVDKIVGKGLAEIRGDSIEFVF